MVAPQPPDRLLQRLPEAVVRDGRLLPVRAEVAAVRSAVPNAVLKVIDPVTATNVDLNDVRIVTRVGGTMDDTELIDADAIEIAQPLPRKAAS